MSTRIVKIYSTVGTSGTIQTNVTTLGELLPILAERSISTSGMKMLVGETKNELALEDAKLPEGDFKLFLMPEKTKSGNELPALFNQLAAVCTRIAENFENGVISATASSEEVRATLSDEDAANFAELKALQEQNEW